MVVRVALAAVAAPTNCACTGLVMGCATAAFTPRCAPTASVRAVVMTGCYRGVQIVLMNGRFVWAARVSPATISAVLAESKAKFCALASAPAVCCVATSRSCYWAVPAIKPSWRSSLTFSAVSIDRKASSPGNDRSR